MPGIIKAGRLHTSTTSVRATEFNFDDMSSQASGYLDSVQKRADQIIKQARQEAREITERAKQEGHAAALAAARVDAEAAARQSIDQQLATLVPALQEAVQSIHGSKQAWIKHWEDRAIALSAGIAQRVIRRELSQDPNIPITLLREALELATSSGQITIHMNPTDLETLRERVETLVRAIETVAEADIVADDEISPGGCRVVTEFGTIDNTLETQLARIEEELK